MKPLEQVQEFKRAKRKPSLVWRCGEVEACVLIEVWRGVDGWLVYGPKARRTTPLGRKIADKGRPVPDNMIARSGPWARRLDDWLPTAEILRCKHHELFVKHRNAWVQEDLASGKRTRTLALGESVQAVEGLRTSGRGTATWEAKGDTPG